MQITFKRAAKALVVTATLLVCAEFGHGANPAPRPAMEPRALDLLKALSARLAPAKSFSFRTRSANEGPGKAIPSLTALGDAEVAVMRPNKLRARVRGGSPPFDFFFDGATMTAYQPTLNVYATTEASKTLDMLMPFALENAGILLPFADVLYSDPYVTLIRRITRARYAGVSTIAGKLCDHAAFAGPGGEWEIWVDARTALPCRLTGTLPEIQGSPRFAVDFFDWKLDPPLSAASFAFAKPAGAVQMDFRTLIGQ